MALEIALSRDTYAAGDLVRGSVRGMDAWPGARALEVALEHRTKHLDSRDPVTARVELEGRPPSVHPFDLPLPPDAPPGFEGAHYRSAWIVVARLDVPQARDPRAEAPVTVVPGPVRMPPGERAAAPWGGFRAFRRFLAVFAAVDLALLVALLVALGTLPWYVAAAIVVPAIVSLATLGFLAATSRAVDALEVRAPRRAWRFGERVPVTVVVDGAPDRIAALDVRLAGEETWVVSTGRTAQRKTVAFHEDTRRLAGADLRAARTGARRWTWDVPLGLPDAGHPSEEDRIAWTIRARAEVPGRPDAKAELALEVAGAVPADEAGPARSPDAASR